MVAVSQRTCKVRPFHRTHSLVRQIKTMRPDILVCTPGRLIDLLNNEGLNLDKVEYQILDEGDKMLDMGFEEDILEI